MAMAGGGAIGGGGVVIGGGGDGGSPPPPSPTTMQALATSYIQNAVYGTGWLEVGGILVAKLYDITYSGHITLYEQVLGADVGMVAFRQPLVMESTLKAKYGDVLNNVELFTICNNNIINGVLRDYQAVFTGWGGYPVISFAYCNIIPQGDLSMSETGWATGSIEIKSSRRTLANFGA